MTVFIKANDGDVNNDLIQNLSKPQLIQQNETKAKYFIANKLSKNLNNNLSFELQVYV